MAALNRTTEFGDTIVLPRKNPSLLRSDPKSVTMNVSREAIGSVFERPIQRLTEADHFERGNTITASAAIQPLLQPQLKSEQQVNHIDAVVGARLSDTIILSCSTADHRNFNVRLPVGLVPEELCVFGKPVRVSLRTTDGIRLPFVEAREISASGPTPDAALDNWIDEL